MVFFPKIIENMLVIFVFAAVAFGIPQVNRPSTPTTSLVAAAARTTVPAEIEEINTANTDLSTKISLPSPTPTPITLIAPPSTQNPSLLKRPVFFALVTCGAGLLMVITGLIVMFHRKNKFRAVSSFNRPTPPNSGAILQESGKSTKSVTPSYSASYQTTSITSLAGTAVRGSSLPRDPVFTPVVNQDRFSFLSNGSLANFEVAIGSMTQKSGSSTVYGYGQEEK